MHELINRYLACWNETDSATRRELIGKTWTDDVASLGPDGRLARVVGFLDKIPA
jgi:hypothetical protein